MAEAAHISWDDKVRGHSEVFIPKLFLPILTAWGKNDKIFIAPGAEAFRRDVKNLETKWLDAGHFALETNEVQK